MAPPSMDFSFICLNDQSQLKELENSLQFPRHTMMAVDTNLDADCPLAAMDEELGNILLGQHTTSNLDNIECQWSARIPILQLSIPWSF
jgi:hypothetical protein